MTYLMSIDPGESTGIALGEYLEDMAYTRIAYWQIEGGLDGFLAWCEAHIEPETGRFWYRGNVYPVEWVSERFTLRSANKFTANIEPVRIEGALVALGFNPAWQDPADKSLCPDAVLKESGLWLTGKLVGCKDARDANDATIHALARMKKIRHVPTIKKYWGEEAAA